MSLNPRSTINPRPRAIDSGATDVECTGCPWTAPGEHHIGHGSPERTGLTAYMDKTLPLMGAHIDATGHTIRVITTTWSANGLVEQGDVLMSPRTETVTV